MAKISAKNIELKDSERIIFGTDDDAFIEWDEVGNQLEVSTVVSGVDPTEDHHLTTRYFVESTVDSVSGTLQSGINYYSDHGNLSGLEDDDHPYYVPRNGSRGFTSTVSGVDATEGYHLITRDYLIEVLEGTASGVTLSGFNTIFGSDFDYEVDETESSTNSTTYQQKLRLYASATASGSFRIGYTFEWRGSKLNTEVAVQVQVDDTDTAYELTSKPIVDVNTWRSVTGFYYEPTLNSGSHTVDVDYRSTDTSATAYIRKVRLEFWRVF